MALRKSRGVEVGQLACCGAESGRCAMRCRLNPVECSALPYPHHQAMFGWRALSLAEARVAIGLT